MTEEREMTLAEKAQRVISAQIEGDLRYQEFVKRLSERTGLPENEVAMRIVMLAMGHI